MARRRLLKAPQKVFPGWWIAISGGVLSLWGFGYMFWGLSALFKPISQELGFTRAATALAASLAKLEGGLFSPVMGWASDRFGPRMLMFLGMFLLGLGLVLMRYVDSLWAFCLVWGLVASVGIDLSLGVPLGAAIANWFVRKRGMAMGVRSVLGGLSGVLVLPLVAWLTLTYGWRQACFIGGVVMWAIGFPLTALFIKPHRPEYYGLLPDGASVERLNATPMIQAGIEYAAQADEVEFTLRQAMKTRAYWLLSLAYTFEAMFWPVMSVHCIPFLTDRGMSPMAAAATVSIYVFASIPTRFLGGLVADRVNIRTVRFLMLGCYFMQAVGVGLFVGIQSMAALYVFFILFGLGLGAVIPMDMVLKGRYFGRKGFASIQGSSIFLIMPAAVAGPVFAGWIYDTTGSYMTAFTLLAAALATCGVTISFARSPRPPAQITDITRFL